MNREIIDTPLIDTNLSSYHTFFDYDWAKRTFVAVKDTPLEEAVNSLVVAWRSTNGAHILPWLMVESLKRFAQGELEGSLQYRACYADKVIGGIVNKLMDRMHYSLNHDQRRSLRRVVTKIEEEAGQAVKIARQQVQLDVGGYWDFLVNASEFQFSILGIQRINYGSLFFAYEDFIANLLRTKEPTYSSKDRRNPIPVALSNHFGARLADFCWNHDEVCLARLVRNALAHNGGRFGQDLEKYRSRFTDVVGTDKPLLCRHQFNLVDRKIQITPDNTAYLFDMLKDRVSTIVGEALSAQTTRGGEAKSGLPEMI